MKTKKFKAIRTTEKITKEQFNALAEKDKWKHTSHYKRVPVETGSVVYSKYQMIDGVPHKAVNGAWVALAKKA